MPLYIVGVLVKNENKLDDMVEIMDELQKYIPSIRTVQHFDGNGDACLKDIESNYFSLIVLGRDQLHDMYNGSCNKKSARV